MCTWGTRHTARISKYTAVATAEYYRVKDMRGEHKIAEAVPMQRLLFAVLFSFGLRFGYASWRT
jgi:hypothetical protein